MMNTKRVLAILLALVMAFALLACGETPAPSEPAGNDTLPPASSADPADESWKEVAAKVDIPEIIKKDLEHLSWMDDTSDITLNAYYTGQAMGDTSTWGSTAVEQHITDLTGVSLDIQFAEDAELNDLTLLIASGDPLPDMICYLDKNGTHYKDMVEAGALWDLAELIDTYCPEMWDNLDPYLVAANKNADGTMYYFPRQTSTASMNTYMVSNGWFAVRGDVCEDMGIKPEDIKTLTDLENFMQYYLDNAANYPEIKYPMWTPITGNVVDPRPFYASLGGDWPYAGSTGLIYDEAADTVSWWVETEIGKETLKYYNSLAKKGYMTENAFANGGYYNDMCAGVALCVVGENAWGAPYANDTLKANGSDAYYVRIPMVSAEGVDGNFTGFSYTPGSGSSTVITKDCKDPARAIKFLEFMSSEYGNATVHCGVYGEDWVVEEVDGVACAKPLNKEVAEGETPRGIYNYNNDWIVASSHFDYVYSYSANVFGTDQTQVNNAKDFVYDLKSLAPSQISYKMDVDSTEYAYGEAQKSIFGEYIVNLIFAKDDAEFEKLYTDFIAALEGANLAEYKAYCLALTKEYIAEQEAMGVKFN